MTNDSSIFLNLCRLLEAKFSYQLFYTGQIPKPISSKIYSVSKQKPTSQQHHISTCHVQIRFPADLKTSLHTSCSLCILIIVCKSIQNLRTDSSSFRPIRIQSFTHWRSGRRARSAIGRKAP